MISAGIDVGSKNVYVIIIKNGKVITKVTQTTGINKAQASETTYDEALKKAHLKRLDIDHVLATGTAASRAKFAQGIIPEATADALGVIRLIPSARTIVDIGAEEGIAIKINAEGKVLDLALNEKCAAGTGTFLDAMARALELPVEDMAKISLQSTKTTPMNAQCAVFGESEVISLIHQKMPKQDIARAVHDAVARRLASVARIVGLEKDIVAVGGVAQNTGFIESLKRELNMDINVPEDPNYVGALGAAIAAEAGIFQEQIKAKTAKKDKI